MKATELRIGNYVTFTDETNTIVAISPADFAREFHKGYHFDGYEPIPLTEEWLVKFGYSDTNDEMYNVNIWMLGDDIHVSPVVSSTGIHGLLIYGYLKYFEDVYVHQLQNLYHALTGEELTIK